MTKVKACVVLSTYDKILSLEIEGLQHLVESNVNETPLFRVSVNLYVLLFFKKRS